MFEYHGWVTISETPSADTDDALLRRTADRVYRKLSELGDHHLLDLRWMNDYPTVHIAGIAKHRGNWGEQISELYTNIARLAPGSYGLLYVRDDGHAFHGNEFRVYRLARGQVSEHSDPFLSPIVPGIHDPYYAELD